MDKTLIINSLGEVFFDGVDVAGGVYLNQLGTELGRAYDKTDVHLSLLRDLFNHEGMTLNAVRATILTWELQDMSDSRCRFGFWNGSLRVVTEVNAFDDQVDFWVEVERLVKSETLDRYDMIVGDPHVDRSSTDGGETWVEGPNHGRLESQTEISIPLDYLTTTKDSATAAKARLERLTETLWEQQGVSVI